MAGLHRFTQRCRARAEEALHRSIVESTTDANDDDDVTNPEGIFAAIAAAYGTELGRQIGQMIGTLGTVDGSARPGYVERLSHVAIAAVSRGIGVGLSELSGAEIVASPEESQVLISRSREGAISVVLGPSFVWSPDASADLWQEMLQTRIRTAFGESVPSTAADEIVIIVRNWIEAAKESGSLIEVRPTGATA